MRDEAALIQTNFHTHTRRCKHAGGTDEDMVKAAIENGYKVLGFSDHAAWKYDSGYVPYMRMELREFAGYKKSIRELQEKYKDCIRILLGMEAEYFPRYMDWMLDFCIEQEVDYLILGNHFHETDELGIYYGRIGRKDFEVYIDSCLAGLATGMYSYLAHPELPLRSLEWDDGMIPGFERLCRFAREKDIPLEYNVLGMQANKRTGKFMYPHPEFWKIAGRMGCKAIIGMDAHHPKDLRQSLYLEARRNLERYGIQLADTIPIKDFKALKANKDR